MNKMNGKLRRAKGWDIFDVHLSSIIANRSNPRDSSPVLLSMGYGIFEALPKSDKPTLMSMALSTNPAMRLAYVDLIERFEPALAEQGMSIHNDELYQHIALCHETEDTYDVVFGCRRILSVAYNACKFNLDDPVIPARICDWDISKRALVSFIENHHRLGQTAIDEAKYYKRMAESDPPMPIPEIAARCHVNEQHVRLRLRLNNLPQEIQDKVASGKIGITKATKMAGMSEEDLRAKQEDMEKKKTRRRMPTVRELREWYENDNGLSEDVRRFIATRLLRVRYAARKHVKGGSKRAAIAG